MTVCSITLPWPVPALRSNGRAHWRAKAAATKSARFAAKALAIKAGLTPMPSARIFIEYYPKSYRGDVHNVPSSLKAYIDGIADAMGCDDRQFQVDFPALWAGKSPQGEVVFRVEQPSKALGGES
jgi:crossover junction endodeoxyribonuclease RusA